MDVNELRIKNYTAALDQSQRYLTLTAISAVGLWLLRSTNDASGPLVVVPFPVPVNASTARMLLFAIHFVCGALAQYSVETAKRAVVPLSKLQDIAEALRDYPSIAASVWPGVRLAVPVISLVLLVWTGLSIKPSFAGTFSPGFWLALLTFSVHAPLLMMLWMPPLGSWTAATISRDALFK